MSLKVSPGEDSTNHKDVSLENSNQESNQETQPEIPEERILIWRCGCGAEMDRFGKEFTAHIKEGRAKGEDHKWKLVDVNSGEIVAENMREANILGLKATRKELPPKQAGGKGSNKTVTDEEFEKYRPRSPLVTKWVAYTVELPTDLIVLYKLFVDRCVSLGKEPPAIGEWVTQVIAQFYLEHAEDFDIRGMAGEFILKNVGGKDG